MPATHFTPSRERKYLHTPARLVRGDDAGTAG
jgi:hypothetical protein